MAKITRRNFLKGLAVIGAISPFFNAEAIKANLDNFTSEQVEALKEVDSIKECEPGPYFCVGAPSYYRVMTRDGREIYYSRDELVHRYGSITGCFRSDDVDSVSPGFPEFRPANWND